jgi:RNA-directed DNA polymerase
VIAHCVGGVISPLLANIALSALDEHLHAPWKPGGEMSTSVQRAKRVRHREPNWRVVRYADDFVVLVHGERHHVESLHDQIADVLAPLGLRLSAAKTQIVHMSEGFDFLGFHIRWRRKRGTTKWYVYTFIGDRPFRSVKAKIRALTPRTSQWDLRAVLVKINLITRGWSNYFKHAIAKRTFEHLHRFTWQRIARMMRKRHRWRWKDVRRWLTDPATGRWQAINADGIELFNPAAIPIRRYRYRGNIPTPWATAA